MSVSRLNAMPTFVAGHDAADRRNAPRRPGATQRKEAISASAVMFTGRKLEVMVIEFKNAVVASAVTRSTLTQPESATLR
jgi:hypothetical protein